MIINALNSGAIVFMADFEDANSPTWVNMVDGPGQPSRRHRAARSSYTQPRGQALPPRRENPAVAVCAPRAGICPKNTADRRRADVRLPF